MRINIRDAKEAGFACDAVVIPLIEGEGIKPYTDIDRSLGGLPSKIISSKEFRAEHNEALVLHTYGKIKAKSVFLIGLGKRSEATAERLRQAGGKTASYLTERGFKDVCLSTRTISSLNLMPSDFIEGGLLSSYRFGKYKKEENSKALRSMTVLSARKSHQELKPLIKYAEAVSQAVNFARDLINTPSNDMTPSALLKAAKSISGENVSVAAIGRRGAERLGMGAYLSVAKGSTEPPVFIIIRYKGGREASPIALVGKSITFDSGGISLKPSEGMEKMKYDMSGGAAVLGVIKAASALGLPVNLIGILPATENLPGGSASKPGDVVRTIDGRTVEIINTDAEGRLVLADAIGYVKRLKPEAVIDIATLTGACSVALGNEAMAMMGNDEALIKRIEASSRATGERVWRMPLYEEYKEYIKSDIAELKNSGGKSGSLVTAAYFLKEFAGQTPWVHLDIAGTAWAEKDKPYCPKGATGAGVRLLTDFLSRS